MSKEQSEALANNYALIIGVGDYNRFSRSAGRAPGEDNVPGGPEDARMWVETCLTLGIPAENIVVASAPKLDPAMFGPRGNAVTCMGATHDEIVKGLSWLEDKVTGEAPASGLVTFTGHANSGGPGASQLMLCPSDTILKDGKLENVINVTMTITDIVNKHLGDRMTFCLDCCSASLAQSNSLRTMLLRYVSAIRPGYAEEMEKARVLSAAEWNEHSQTGIFGGLEHGAFTWALTSAIGQWLSEQDDHNTVQSHATYGQLLERSIRLIRDLDYRQMPTLTGPENVAKLPFLADQVDEPLDELIPPDGVHHKLQLTPDVNQAADYSYYTLSFEQNNVFYPFATIIASKEKTSGTIYVKKGNTTGTISTGGGVEYWITYNDNVKTLQHNYGEQSLTLMNIQQGWGTYQGSSESPVVLLDVDISQRTTGVATTWSYSGQWIYSQPFHQVGQAQTLAFSSNIADVNNAYVITKTAWYQTVQQGQNPMNIAPMGNFNKPNSSSAPQYRALSDIVNSGNFIDWS